VGSLGSYYGRIACKRKEKVLEALPPRGLSNPDENKKRNKKGDQYFFRKKVEKLVEMKSSEQM